MHRVAERLVFRRNALNLTQDELAEHSGVSKRAIVDYETGKGQPTPRILSKLAAALRWEVADFYAPPPADRMRETYDNPARGNTEAELWKTRALAAESKLTMLREALRRLVEASSDAPPPPDAIRRERAVQIGLDAASARREGGEPKPKETNEQ